MILSCTSCGIRREVESDELHRYTGAGRAWQRDGTGGWSSRPIEYVTSECDPCYGDRAKHRPDVPLQMAKVRRHQLEMEARGVPRDVAIAYAVEREVTLGEIRLSPAFVAKVHGLTDLLTDGTTPPNAGHTDAPAPGWEAQGPSPMDCAEDGCVTQAVENCDACERKFCNRHITLIIAVDGGQNHNLCRGCRMSRED